MTTLVQTEGPSTGSGNGSESRVGPDPLVFTGEDGFTVARLLETRTTESADGAWADEVIRGLEPNERALVSLAFVSGGPAVAHRISAAFGTRDGFTEPAHAEHAVVATPSEETYADSVRRALVQIAAGDLDKVVLGRCLDVVSRPALHPADVVARLLATRPGRYVFSMPLGAEPDAPLLLGASPELLVRRRGDQIFSHPLAGSAPRAADPAEDRARGRDLLQSSKDLAEHAFVVEAIVRALEPVCTEIVAPSRPELLATDALWHLGTPIRARLRSTNGPTALHLAQLLHPTPAVGGVPHAAALAQIAELEGDLRGPLAGAVGWVGPDGDGEFAVTIRAGVLDGDHLRLFAGAGIVAGSDPYAEVRETAAKLSTMARAVGLPRLGEVSR